MLLLKNMNVFEALLLFLVASLHQHLNDMTSVAVVSHCSTNASAASRALTPLL
jgi:hypothetical protein